MTIRSALRGAFSSPLGSALESGSGIVPLVSMATQTLSPLLTFARSGTTATYVNAAGTLTSAAANLARWDYDPNTLAIRGLLMETAATNLLTFSGNLENAAWTSTGITQTGSAATAPDGTASAALLAKGAIATQFIARTFAATSAIRYAGSVYLKSGTLSKAALGMVCGTTTYSYDINLSAGTATAHTTSGTGALVFMSNAGAGWWRVGVYITAPSTSTLTMSVYVGNISDAVAGNIYGWGGQLEARGYPTSYIPTTGSTATRNADSLSGTTGPWVGTRGGTLFCDYELSGNDASSFPRLMALVGANANNDEISMSDSVSSTSLHSGVTVGGSGWGVSQLINTQIDTALVRHKSAIAYSSAGASGASDAAMTDILNAGTLPAIVGVQIFGPVRFQIAPTGRVKNANFGGTPLSLSALISITT